MFFRLKSKELEKDYSDYTEPVNVFNDAIYCLQDDSDPVVSEIAEEYIDYENKVIGVTVSAKDDETPMMYYSYSIDGGESFSEYFPWPSADMLKGESPYSFTLEISIPIGISPKIVVKAINQYDRYKLSNMLTDYPVFEDNSQDETGISDVVVSGNDTEPADVPVTSVDLDDLRPLFSFLFIIGLLFLFTLIVSNMLFKRSARHKRRRRRRSR